MTIPIRLNPAFHFSFFAMRSLFAKFPCQQVLCANGHHSAWPDPKTPATILDRQLDAILVVCDDRHSWPLYLYVTR